ncbi:hypothetical protein BAE44_0008480 [Dichanthelium oligosanthes]|uniref:No apical meristem-associated C-terminal domain-containing protein n=1 Tax=Dichanthelium oligosanthes TaxID=888268 RepID=A0A1E5VZD7_9POAL|nr:hypothetical protein BAE44_0008480 [Dichanthelium oligosanthes]
MDPQVEKLRKALEGLVAMVFKAPAMMRTIAVNALSPYSLPKIDSINLDLINIESITTEIEQQALECEAVHPQQLGDMHFMYELMRDAEPGVPQVPPAPPIVPILGRSSNPPVEPPRRQGRVKTAERKPKQPNFGMSEDLTLCLAWLNVSLDPIIGNGQRKAAFWKRIERKYNAEKGDNFSARTIWSLEGRWQYIKEQVGKFEVYFIKVYHENQSGQVDTDKTTAAVTLYNSIETKPFIFLHCWEVLREQPKWTDLQDKSTHVDTFVETEAEDGDSMSHVQDSTSFVDRMAMIGKHNSDVREQFNKLIDLDMKKLTLKDELVSMKRIEQDERILGMDLATLNPMQRVMFVKL